jgi:predicted transcriptional regulator
MSEQKKNPKEGQLNIELPEEIAEGIYSNLAIINHSVSEFVVDFISIMPGRPKAKVKSRIVLTPQHAKRLVKALADNVKKFEQQHGEIKDYDKQPQIPMNFGPTGQA